VVYYEFIAASGEPAALIFSEMKSAYTQKISNRVIQCSLLSVSKRLKRKKNFRVAYANRRLYSVTFTYRHNAPFHFRVVCILRGWADKFYLHLNRKWTGKRHFSERKKEICQHQLFLKLHNCFSTKSQRTSIHFRQRCTSFWNPSFKKLVFCFWNHFLTADLLYCTVLTSTHWWP
jgi:hypothetical protein